MKSLMRFLIHALFSVNPSQQRGSQIIYLYKSNGRIPPVSVKDTGDIAQY